MSRGWVIALAVLSPSGLVVGFLVLGAVLDWLRLRREARAYVAARRAAHHRDGADALAEFQLGKAVDDITRSALKEVQNP